MTEDKYRQYKN